MTDLPRFTGGSLGPISFAQVNEMMRRLDALKPLIETVGVTRGDEADAKDSVLLVYAKKTSSIDYPDRYDWREIAVRNVDKDNPTETVANYTEDDWEEIELDVVTRGGTVLDEKGEESETYAISVADFEEGFAFCFVRRSLDGRRRYVLVPLVAGTTGAGPAFSDLYLLEAVIGDGGSVPFSDSSGSVDCFIYTARSLTPTVAGNEVRLAKGSEVFVFYDFGLANPNIPSVSTGAILTPRPLAEGTVFRGTLKELPTGQRIGYVALPPRLDVECA